MHQGELRELQKDNTTVIVSNVQYDWQKDQSKGVLPWDQVPIKKEKKAEESIKDKQSNSLVKSMFNLFRK
jgi:Ni,Fe-hydrogenase I large subunit